MNTSQHVIDSSASNADEQREAVLQVLRDIGVPQAKLDTCMVEAWNKVIFDRLLLFHQKMYEHGAYMKNVFQILLGHVVGKIVCLETEDLGGLNKFLYTFNSVMFLCMCILQKELYAYELAIM